MQGDKLVVVGAGLGANSDFLVARFDGEARLDPTFGDGGVLVTDFGGDGGNPLQARNDDSALVVAVSGDKLYVGGAAWGPVTTGGAAMALARYTADGQLDPTFSGDGKVVSQFSSSGNESMVTALLPLSDGRVYAGGRVYNGATNGGDYVLVRYTAAGAPDPTAGW